MFSGCKHLVGVDYNGTLTSLPEYFFYGCSALQFEIPSTLTIIGDYAFYNCTSLSGNICFPTNVAIGTYGFGYCESIEEISFAGAPAALGDCCFYNSGVKKLDFVCPKRFYWDSNELFASCTNLEEVTLPDDMTFIPKFMFAYCKNLKCIHFPKNLKIIYTYAFQDCGLETLEFPETLTTIQNNAFAGCQSLKIVKILCSEVWIKKRLS